jgi:hypothetical protein
MKAYPIRELRIKTLFRATHETLALNLVMRNMRGNIQAKTLLVAPPPDLVEFQEERLPFSNEAAKFFHEVFLTQAGLDTQKHFCIVAAAAFGEMNAKGLKKYSKASTQLIRDFVERCAKEGLFERFISVGSDAYHAIFGDRVVSGPFNPGLKLYPLQLQFKGDALPVFTLPNINGLVLTAEPESREEWRQIRARESLVKGLIVCAKSVKQFINS